MPDIRNESPRTRKLRRALEDQRDRIMEAIHVAIREGRSEGAMDDAEVQDEAERSEADVQTEVEFALLQTYGETLRHIVAALDRLDTGRYGCCVDCGAHIADERLNALPFAIRCLDCEQRQEVVAADAGRPTWRDAVHMLEMGR